MAVTTQIRIHACSDSTLAVNNKATNKKREETKPSKADTVDDI
jgi:hypothetical protein